MTLYLEDLIPGLVVTTDPITVTEADAIRFASDFDPQYFHTDPVAARDSMFNGLALSGWHTAVLSMRMAVRSPLSAIVNGLVGIEVRSLRWPRPARPGDTLRVTVEVLESKRSRSRPGWGTALLRWTTNNQNDDIVMNLESVIWVACRPAGPA